MADIRIQTAHGEEPGLLSTLHARCFETVWSAAAFTAMIGDAHTHGLIARDGANTVGCILYRTVADEAEILTIFVAPEMQKQGIGRKLLTRCLADIKQTGVTTLYLEAPENNAAALELYESAGFRKNGRRKNYYRRGEKMMDAVLMEYRI